MRHDPLDATCLCALLEEVQNCVDASLAPTNHTELGQFELSLRKLSQVVHRLNLDAFSNCVRRTTHGRHCDRQISRVHQLPLHSYQKRGLCAHRRHLVDTLALLAHILVRAKVTHAACGHKLLHDHAVVSCNLGAAG